MAENKSGFKSVGQIFISNAKSYRVSSPKNEVFYNIIIYIK